MPRIVRPLRTRGYELDADTTVRGSTLLRYMEHMRWESVTSPNVPIAKMFRDGFRMVVRAQELEIHASLDQGVDLEISLEFGHVGRASMEMLHEIVRVSDGQRVARGVVIGVYLSPDGSPHPVPAEIREQTMCERRTRLVQPPSAEHGAEVWSRPLSVMPSDLDLFQHVNHARYLDFFDDTRRLAAAASAYGTASEKLGGALFRAAIDYRQQALLGEDLTVSTWRCPEESGAMGFELRKRDGEVLSACRLEVRA